MRKILEELAAKDRRPVAQIILFLLEKALAAEGLWPPKGGKEAGDE
jgi:hypothetical protein